MSLPLDGATNRGVLPAGLEPEVPDVVAQELERRRATNSELFEHLKGDVIEKLIQPLTTETVLQPLTTETVIQPVKFGCIVADPAWSFNNKASRAGADDHYPTMEARKIEQIPVDEWAADNSHLYLWVTDSHLQAGLRVMEQWGFVYKQTIVWLKIKNGKPQMGMGNYYRHAHEICLFGVRGRCPTLDKGMISFFWAERGEHSAKPEDLQTMAEKMSPGPYLELFARRPRTNWAHWGLDRASFER